MTAHLAAHGERLVRILGEADDPRGAFEASELASCPECRAQIEDVARLEGLLDEVARDERESIERAAALAGAPGEDRVAEIVATAEREAGPAPGAKGPTPLPPPLPHAPPPTSDAGMPLRVWMGLAALIAIVAAFWLWPQEEGPPGPNGVMLGPARLELLEPVGEVDAFDTFRWTGELGPAWTFRVRVRDAESADARWTESPRLDSGEWTPSEEQRASWGDAIEWEVQVLDATGVLVESRRSSASLSSD